MDTIQNSKKRIIILALSILLLNVTFSFAQNSGVWTKSGSGSSSSWSATAGDVGITATATGYGAGTSYTMNDFITNDTMGCNNSAYFDNSVVGNPSLSIRHTFPNTAQMTFTFSTAVESPVLNFDRLGGGQVSSLTSSSLITILTPGITFTELSENDVHFVTTSTTVGREAGMTYNSLPSECGPPLDGTASGSVRLNGVFNTITFEISMDAVGSTSSINDRWEIAFSDVNKVTLDFDGVNDYISRNAFLGNKTEATMMSWIKLDAGFNGGEVMGQRNFRIFIDASNRLKTYVKTDSGSTTSATTSNSDAPVLQENLWYHVAALYDGANGTHKLFLNGDLVWQTQSLSGTKIINTNAWNTDHDFEIGRNTYSNNNYFEGSIYETRVYNKALTDNQLQRQIYQEIQNNSGNVRGAIIPKDIEGLVWSDLELYYKMDILSTGQTTDDSVLSLNGNLHGMRTYQDKTAPLPYVTKAGGNGNWNDSNNWLYGEVWDIADNHTASAIVKITKDLITNEDHSTVGLIIENGNELTVNNDSGIQNSWYVKLDGKIDLEGESQFVQTIDSDLSLGANGNLERDQQGTKDLFTYNYWSSPVGTLATANTSQNPNTFEYSIKNILNDGTTPSTPSEIKFTDGYNGSASPLTISNYWIWKFADQLDDDYASWQHVGSTGTVLAGEGYTMKGVDDTSGNVSLEQNYVFNGKPNNGTIELPLDAGNDYLVGNPYASALDAHQFIMDNAPTINGTGNTTGTLYFWEHWGGGSHNLAEYQGGYAIYNLSGSTASPSKGTSDPDVSTNGTATKLPGRYIPVSQGFFVIGENSGTIKFNNGQRVFHKEGSNSVFMSPNSVENDVTSYNDEETDDRMKLRIGFNSVNQIHRQLLVTRDVNATENKDWGFDAILYDSLIDDMYWMINDEKFTIQGINEIDETSIFPIGLHTNKGGLNTITIDDLENVPNDLDIYVHDIDLGVYHNLRTSDYQVELAAGEYLNRFEIVFYDQALSVDDAEVDDNQLQISFENDTRSIKINNPKSINVDGIEMYTMLGQSIIEFNEKTNNNLIKIKTHSLSSGAYIIALKTDFGTITNKVLVK